METELLLVLSAFLAGAINSIAGGGTLLTFPSLTRVISEAAANATSTIALLPGSLAGAWGFRREIAASRKFVLLMLAPSLLGGLLGAWLVVQNPIAFANLVPWLIFTAAMLFLVQQPLSAWLRKHKPHHEPGWRGKILLILAQFLIAVYGGYFGAGIGILMLTALGFLGVGDIHRMNGVKTILATTINAASVLVFLGSGSLIHWRYAPLMAVAAVAGGYLGARGSRRLQPRIVRGIVVVIGFSLAVYYFSK